RPEVFDRLVARADGIGRAPARARRASAGSIPQEFNNNNSPEEELDSFDDVRDEPGHRVLDDLVGFVRRFVAFTNPQQADAVALFVVHTYAVNVADSSARTSAHSPDT